MTIYTHRKSRNYGYGKQISFAGKNVLRESYNEGHFATVNTHHKRWVKFCVWLKVIGNIKDAKDVTKEILESYGRHLYEQVFNDDISVAYAQNLLSSVNTVLELLRQDQFVKISPSKFLGKRNNVRETPPLSLNMKNVNFAIAELNVTGNKIAAAVFSSARAFGLREREAVLLDYNIALKQGRKNKQIIITEGSKGGRAKKIPRVIDVSSYGMSVLENNAELQCENNNLIPENMSWFKLDIDIHKQAVRDIMKKYNLKFYHDARAAWACERYFEITGIYAPVVSGEHVVNEDKDLEAREIISLELGHSRTNICVSYVGSSKT